MRRGQSPRQFLPDRLWFVTNRTINCEFLFSPVPAIRRAMAEWLVRKVPEYGIRLFAFVVMNNHYHLVLADPEQRLFDFMRDFQSQSSRLINRHWGRVEATCYGGSYRAIPILEEEYLIERILYTVLNPVAADLVERAVDWPGLTAAPSLLHGRPLEAEVFDRTAWHRAGGARRANRRDFQRRACLELAIPDSLSGLTTVERQAFWRQEVRAREDRLRRERKTAGRSVLGLRRLLGQSHRSRPHTIDRSPIPLSHGSPAARSRYREERCRFERLYSEASSRYLAGESDVQFPPGSLRPWVRTVA